jgi:phosphoribosylformylglycinamidine cyclo-ligase
MNVDYASAGVKGQGSALSAVARHLGPTLSFPDPAEVLTRFGQYASVIKIADEMAIAISTDGVGSKTIIASALDRYETIGFDCVAMNVNDVACVGARPIAMVDYLGVHALDASRTDRILEGLGAAAKEAGIAIPGGEVAQLPDIIGSDGGGAGDKTAFDLVGTCIGVVHPARMVLGDAIEVGDAIVGIASSGIHSNGLTLARQVLLKSGRFSLSDHEPALGRTIGEELLAPTKIYARAVRAMGDEDVDVRGLVHVTSDGLANLCRLDAPVGYDIEALPDTPPIFDLIKDVGDIRDSEMFRVFNMGIGFVAVVPEGDAERAVSSVEGAGYAALRIGTVTSETGVVRLCSAGLVGSLSEAESRFRPER